MEHFFKDYTEFSSADDETVPKFNYNNGFNFRVDDNMLDFPTEKETMTNAVSGHTSVITAVDNTNSSISGGVRINESQFSENELCVPVSAISIRFAAS